VGLEQGVNERPLQTIPPIHFHDVVLSLARAMLKGARAEREAS